MTAPIVVKQAAAGLIDDYGDNIEYVKTYQGKDVYLFRFPEDVEVGFPFYFLYDGVKVETITGFDALYLGSILFKD